MAGEAEARKGLRRRLTAARKSLRRRFGEGRLVPSNSFPPPSADLAFATLLRLPKRPGV